MSNIHFAKLTLDDIPFLHEDHTLISVDFRATGESLSLPIPAMFKYENLSQWLVSTRLPGTSAVVVNNAIELSDKQLKGAQMVTVDLADTEVTSVYDRLGNPPEGIKYLWVAVPHPAADAYARRHKLAISNTYDDFLRLNDKLAQKEYLGTFAPEHRLFTSDAEFRAALKKPTGFVKHRHGAGGYKVVPPDRTARQDYATQLGSDADYREWYEEEAAAGEPYSVQAVRDGNGKITIFGYTKQMVEGTIYVGGEVYNLSDMPDVVRRQLEQVTVGIQPFLKGYRGFFGIDFMLQPDQSLLVLELNVRMTAITIPTLLGNDTGTNSSVSYQEDVPLETLHSHDIVLARDAIGQTADIMRLSSRKGACLGEVAYIKLSNCKQLPAGLDTAEVAALSNIIGKSVSRSVASHYHNFWPYGWTLSYILAESHCVLSTWHTEQIVLVDVFCCSTMDKQQLADDLAAHFKGNVAMVESQERFQDE